MQKIGHLCYLIRIITRFWCGRQELKLSRKSRKALKIKGFRDCCPTTDPKPQPPLSRELTARLFLLIEPSAAFKLRDRPPQKLNLFDAEARKRFLDRRPLLRFQRKDKVRICAFRFLAVLLVRFFLCFASHLLTPPLFRVLSRKWKARRGLHRQNLLTVRGSRAPRRRSRGFRG